MPNSHVVRAQAVRDRLLSIIHDAADIADLSLEVCIDELQDGSTSVNLIFTSKPIVLPAGLPVEDALCAIQHTTERFVQDAQDFDARLQNVETSDLQTGIFLCESGDQVLFAGTCQAEAEEFVAEQHEILKCELSFVPVPLEDIPKTLRQLATQRVDVPEYRNLIKARKPVVSLKR